MTKRNETKEAYKCEKCELLSTKEGKCGCGGNAMTKVDLPSMQWYSIAQRGK